jgi:hypothetical protein
MILVAVCRAYQCVENHWDRRTKQKELRNTLSFLPDVKKSRSARQLRYVLHWPRTSATTANVCVWNRHTDVALIFGVYSRFSLPYVIGVPRCADLHFLRRPRARRKYFCTHDGADVLKCSWKDCGLLTNSFQRSTYQTVRQILFSIATVEKYAVWAHCSV